MRYIVQGYFAGGGGGNRGPPKNLYFPPKSKGAKFWVGASPPPDVLPFRQVNFQGEIVWNYWNSLN